MEETVILEIRGNERTLGDKIRSLENDPHIEEVDYLAKNLILLLDWIKGNEFDKVIAIGRSSIVMSKMLELFGIEVKVFNNGYNDPELLNYANGHRVVVVDEQIGSGEKARQVLDNLSKNKSIEQYGFASLTDPRDVSNGMSHSQFLEESLLDKHFSENRLFIPQRPNAEVYKFVEKVETVAKFSSKYDHAKKVVLDISNNIATTSKNKLIT